VKPDFPTPPPGTSLFGGDDQACHDAMMTVVNEAMQELKREGVKPPSFRRFYADVRACWEVWRRYV
jgi:rhamnose utilization protein RhaD (predicted bifunctional aldolase and dehydrogenase)